MVINTLQEVASALEALEVPFTQTETSVTALTKGRSGTGHKFFAKLTIETSEKALACSVDGWDKPLFNITAENAIEEYSQRRYMVQYSDGN